MNKLTRKELVQERLVDFYRLQKSLGNQAEAKEAWKLITELEHSEDFSRSQVQACNKILRRLKEMSDG